MQAYKKRILYVIKSILGGCFYFFCSYYIIFQIVAEEDIFIATIGNLLFIFVILAAERIETYIAFRISSRIQKAKPNILSKRFDSYLKNAYLRDSLLRDASLKSALYCFYIVLLVCVALLAADPDFAPLHHMREYFVSVRYGILVLIAVDKYMDQVFKDLKTREDL